MAAAAAAAACPQVSTIGQAQSTSTYSGEATVLEAKGRHDPCVLPRTPPLIEGMAALVLIDAAMIQKTREHQGFVNPADGYFAAGEHGLSAAAANGEPSAKKQRV